MLYGPYSLLGLQVLRRGGGGAATSAFRQVDRRVKPREGALEQIQKKRKQHQAPEMTRRPTIQLWHSAWHLFSGIYIEGYLGLEESYRQEQAWQLLVQKGGPATALNRDRGCHGRHGTREMVLGWNTVFRCSLRPFRAFGSFHVVSTAHTWARDKDTRARPRRPSTVREHILQ